VLDDDLRAAEAPRVDPVVALRVRLHLEPPLLRNGIGFATMLGLGALALVAPASGTSRQPRADEGEDDRAAH
jgi:hypothetical protein